MYCAQCGKEIDDSARFCSHCGAKVAQLDEKPAPEAVSAPARMPKTPKQGSGKKLALKIVAAAAILAVIVAGVLLYLWTRNVADLPDPRAFFASIGKVDVHKSEGRAEYRIFAETDELREATLAYGELLANGYEFVMSDEDLYDNDNFSQDYRYSGDKTLLLRSDEEMAAWYFGTGSLYSDTEYVTVIYFRNYNNFRLTEVQPYEPDSVTVDAPVTDMPTQEAEPGTVCIPSLARYLGTEVEKKEGGNLSYYFDCSPREAMEHYVELLQTDYGLMLYNCYDEGDSALWRLHQEGNEEAVIAIAVDPLSRGRWIVDVLMDGMTEVDGPVWSWPEAEPAFLAEIPDFGRFSGAEPREIEESETQYLFEKDPTEALNYYIEMLQSDYGMELVWNDDMEWELRHADSDEVEVCIALVQQARSIWMVDLIGINVTEVKGPIWTWREIEPVPELVAQPLNNDALQVEKTGEMMDFYSFAMDELKLEEDEDSGQFVCSFKGESCYDVAKAYVELLCSEYDFELVGEPHYESYRSTFFDFVLRYTGDKAGVQDSVQGVHSKLVGNVMIYGKVDRSASKGALWYDDGLTVVDDGYRYGGAMAEQHPMGASLGAGLYRLPDGSFKTSDGRLSASVGQAMILWDGEGKTHDAYYEIQSDRDRLRVTVENQLCFYIPSFDGWEVGIFDADRFIVDSEWAVKELGRHRYDGIPGYSWECMFTVRQNGTYIYPVRSYSGDMKALSLRVMYLDDEVAVFYASASLESAPQSFEALIAVNINVAPTTENGSSGSSSDDDWCIACGNTGKCSTCNGKGTVRKNVPGTSEYIDQTCTKCAVAGKGKCPTCGGR